MRPPLSLRGLLVVFGASLLSFVLVGRYCVTDVPRQDAHMMRNAAQLTGEWFQSVRELKEERALWSRSGDEPGYGWMLGAHYSPITTTLGSREAKETAANPEFAALIVRLLHDAGVDSGDNVGITLSGSFPTLGIATLAATECLGARAVLVSSLGSSSYGANQPAVTWIDIETWLRQHSGLRVASVFVTPGAEGDSGGGLPDDGLGLLQEAARRTGVALRMPETLDEGIRMRTDLFSAVGIAALVNIGGGQTCLGTCPHAPVLPTGLQRSLPACADPGRGVIERVAERGIPVIHVLNIRELAHRFGLPVGGNPAGSEPSGIFTVRSVARIPTTGVILLLLVLSHGGRLRLRARQGTRRDERGGG